MEVSLKEMTKEVETLQKQLLRKEVSLLDQTKNQENARKEIEELTNSKQTAKILMNELYKLKLVSIGIAHLQHKSQAQKAILDQADQREASLKRKTGEELQGLARVDQEHATLRELKQQLEQENTFAFKDMMAAKKVSLESISFF